MTHSGLYPDQTFPEPILPGYSFVTEIFINFAKHNLNVCVMGKRSSRSEDSFFADFYGKHPIVSHVAFIVLTAVLLGWLALIFLDIWTEHGKTTVVPEIRNSSYASAALKLDDAGLSIEISDSIYDESMSPGTVIESWPKAGAVVKPGREVYVTITSFSPRQVVVAMPLTGVSSRQAVSYLEGLGISNIRLVKVPSQFADLVEDAKYKGRDITVGMQLPVNAAVTLDVGCVPQDYFDEETFDDEVVGSALPDSDADNGDSDPNMTEDDDPHND